MSVRLGLPNGGRRAGGFARRGLEIRSASGVPPKVSAVQRHTQNAEAVDLHFFGSAGSAVACPVSTRLNVSLAIDQSSAMNQDQENDRASRRQDDNAAPYATGKTMVSRITSAVHASQGQARTLLLPFSTEPMNDISADDLPPDTLRCEKNAPHRVGRVWRPGRNRGDDHADGQGNQVTCCIDLHDPPVFALSVGVASAGLPAASARLCRNDPFPGIA
jgi:hypothetical protein